LRDGRGQIGPELVNGVADVPGFTNLFERRSVVLQQNSPHGRPRLAGGGPPTYVSEQGDNGSARNTLEDIIARYPGSEAAGKARTRLAALRR
jgi:hypothetical protein